MRLLIAHFRYVIFVSLDLLHKNYMYKFRVKETSCMLIRLELETTKAIMRDDLQQLPPLLLTLLTGGRQSNTVPARPKTVRMNSGLQECAEQQLLLFSKVGRTSQSEQVGPLGNEHLDQPDSRLKQLRPTNEIGINTDPPMRITSRSTQEEEKQPPTPTGEHTIIEGGIQPELASQARCVLV